MVLGGGGGGGGSVRDQTTVTRPTFVGIVWSQFVSDFKNKHTVAKSFSLAKREWLVGKNPKRNDSVTVVRN